MMMDSSIAATWDAFKAAEKSPKDLSLLLSSILADSVKVVYVPTGAGGKNAAQVKDFFKTASVQAESIKDETIVSTIYGSYTVTEETVLTVVHDSEINWLLPNVKPTRKRILIPTVTVAKFDHTGLLVSFTKYWDQASVLKQLGILPGSMYCKANTSETVLPVLGPTIVDKLLETATTEVQPEQVNVAAGLSSARANAERTHVPKAHKPLAGIVPQGEEAPIKTRMHKADIFAASNPPPSTVRPSTRVHQVPGGPSNNIFQMGAEPLAPLKTSIPIDPRRFVSQISFDEQQEIEQANNVEKKPAKRDPNWSSLDETAEEKKPVAKPAKPVTESQWNLADTVQVPVHTGRRMGPHHSNESQISFGYQPSKSDQLVIEDVETETEVQKVPESVVEHVQTVEKVEQSYVEVPTLKFPSGEEIIKKSLYDRNKMSEEAHVFRPSSKVLGPPGGKSNIFFG
ncbi:hypothetical protein HK098_000799 [Nowakowskiella sp. JEL0407]|nr:hypothetical protein HK098_000799 [Nowakowskiella sp. JEL0407]